MPIQNTDIVLYQAQDNTDNENGGGARTGVVVADGAVNNLFPDISRVDTVGGDVALRKVFPVVNTNDRDIYYGAHALIRKTPTDGRVAALLFHTDDPIDRRSEAQSDVEAYLVPSYEAPFYLFGTNVEGAKALTFLQRIEEEIPSVGEVFLLRQGNDEQYIRIQEIDTEEVPYFFNTQDYIRRRLIITIDQALTQEFTGSSFNPAGQEINTCDTFATQQADAAKFYGTKDLGVDANIGDTTVTLDSIFEALVPATKQQLPLVNIQALSSANISVSNDSSIRLSSGGLSAGNPLEVGQSIRPGSVQWNVSGYTDDGNGTFSNGSIVYSIDYDSGRIARVTPSSGGSSGGTVTFIPGNLVESLIQYSKGILVDLSNQGNVFVQNVAPVPQGQNCYIDYRSNGKWYRLNGDVDGNIGGQAGLGAAQINDNGDGTATISMTLGAIPDLDSTIITSWGSTEPFSDVSTEVNDSSTAAQAILKWTLPHKNIDFSSMSFTAEAFTRSPRLIDFSTVSEGQTIQRESITYWFDHANGEVFARMDDSHFSVGTDAANPDNFIDFSYSYEEETAVSTSPAQTFEINNPAFTITATGGTYSIGSAVVAGYTKLRMKLRRNFFQTGSPEEFTVELGGTFGSTALKTKHYFTNVGTLISGTIYGNVNEATGDITLTMPTVTRKTSSVQTLPDGTQATVYGNEVVPKFDLVEVEFISYKTQAISTFSQSVTERIFHHEAELSINLPANVVNEKFKLGFRGGLTARSVVEIEGNDVIYDNNVIGSFDRNAGEITIDYGLFPVNSLTFTGVNNIVTNTLFSDANEGVKNIRSQVFRTSAQDLVTSSLIVRYETAAGLQIATTDSSGNFISGTDLDLVNSYVDTVTGMASMIFTADVAPESIRYDAVAQSTLPVDPELLGLNPVRLPPDGRVPIFEAGRFIVIFDEAETSIATPTDGAIVAGSRTNVAYMEVVDVNGQRLAYDQYTTDRTSGEITFVTPVSLIDRNGGALTGPYRIIDRVEDFVQCVDANVTGSVSISAPLTHNYLAGTAKVASVLVWGDIGARVFNLFSQQLFDVWDDNATQNPTTAQYDNINFPIQVVNADSFSGRWAMIFTGSGTVDVVSEKLGVLIEDASINADIAPINPATGQPYFTIPSGGWGGGWVTSNVLRFNTESGDQNMWIIRSVQPGALTEESDSIQVEIRGDAN